MSSFLTIGLFFVFHRFWSVRNLDIVLLILLAPGLLMVHEGRRRQLRQLESEKVAAVKTEQPRHPSPPADSQSDAPSRPAHTLTALVPAQVDPSEVESAVPQPTADPLLSPDVSTEITDAEIETEIESELATNGHTSHQIQFYGFITLFIVQLCILIRLLLDPLMVRRPLLNPNLTTGGLYFISISLFVFMMGNIVTSTPRMRVEQGPRLPPGYALMHKLPTITTRPVSDALGGEVPPTKAELDPSQHRWTMLAKIMAITAHLAIVTGVVLIGGRHFGNLPAGVGCAALYLMLPYTAQMTGRVDHAVPAALLLWAVLCYRKPLIAGIFFGLAAGLVYFPMFLLPLWISFYWRRGVRRFVMGVVATLGVLVLLLSLGGAGSLVGHFQLMFGLIWPTMEPRGIWGLGWSPYYRLPVIVGFMILSAYFAVWPSPKNLGTLISCSAAMMVFAQFCHGYGGGLYIAWFLPLLLLTIFRPNLQDRVALKVVEGGTGVPVRRSQLEAKSA
ncbi:MAG: hypothetical protein HKN47_05185 [Pirellulaceae bacterium]|nr:hypothetical protein [Pirellulaceae bacterium]